MKQERVTLAEYRALLAGQKPKAHGSKRGANSGASGTCSVCGGHVYARDDVENQAWFHTDVDAHGVGTTTVTHIRCVRTTRQEG